MYVLMSLVSVCPEILENGGWKLKNDKQSSTYLMWVEQLFEEMNVRVGY